MTRLLLGPDLGLYRDGEAPAAGGSRPPVAIASELPYRDSRYGGRVLTVAADGTLTWVLNEFIPPADATKAGAILALNDQGSAEWVYAIPGPGGIVDDEVISSDGDGRGVVFYGNAEPLAPIEGAIYVATRSGPAPPPPNPPTAAPTLTVTSTAGLTGHLSWTAVAAATDYEIAVDGTPVASTTALTYTSTFPESSSHTVTVRGTNAGGKGPASNQVTVVIGNLPPPPVTSLRPTSTTRGTITAGWDYTPPADFDTYVATASAGSITVDKAARSATVTGLPDATDVTVTVTARDLPGATSSAQSTTVRTPDPPLPAAPGAPPGLANTRRGYSSLDYTWAPVVGATSYEVSGDSVNYGSVGTATSFSWTGLAESTNYTLWVRARNAGGAGPASAVAASTLPKIASYTNTNARGVYGYGASPWSGVNITHDSSGILFTVDNWATAGSNNYLFTFDDNLNTGPYSTQADRWIKYSFTLNVAYLYAITAWWGYPGTFRWQAFNGIGNVIQQGAVVGSGGAMGVGPNEVNDTGGGPVTKIALTFGAGQGSPGVFKLREWQMDCLVITGQSANYNPA